jgi:Carboxypeptidase regulatory-like domain/TonB dependent receptor
MRLRLTLTLSITVVIAANLTPCAFGQAAISFAQLNGTVLDTSGRTVVKAEVNLREQGTNRSYSAVSNVAGYYVMPNLPPGRYDLTVAYSGFAKYTQTGLVLTVGQIATVDVTLKVAAAGEVVTVTTEVPPIEPSRTEISQVIDTQQIQNLPISGRLFTDFALLTPGVATGRTSLQSTFTDPTVTRISFGGQRDLNNAVTVDGADNINTATGSQRATPSQEAVSEFRVVNNSFGAEYGRGLGGIVNIVTKSGTNELHGSIYDYFQNNATNARSLLQPAPLADTLRQNQFGATLGGPIKKDRTFFFLNYEGQRRAQAPTYPTLLFAPAANQFLFPGAVDPFPASFTTLQAINAVKTSFNIATENLNVLKTADVDNGFVKVDHQLNTKNRLSARYSIQDATNLNMLVGETLDGGGLGMPSSGRDGLLRDQALVGTWTSTFKPDLVNSVLVQWARRNYGFPGVTGQPNLDVPNLLLLGHNFGAFDRYNESRVQLSDTLSWVKGKHYANFGFDTNYIRNFVIWPGFTPSRDIFPSLADLLASGKSNWGSRTPCPPPLNAILPSPPFPPNTPVFPAPCIAAFFWGAPIGTGPIDPNQPSPPVPTTWENAYLPSLAPDFFVHLNHSYWGFFAQDQWRVTPKLTLNYGMRYDFETGLGDLVNPYHRNIAPRVGLAYSPNSKTVIRAGYGMFYDRYTLTFFFVSDPQRAPVITGLPTSINQTTGTWLLNSLFIPTPCFLPGCPVVPPGSPAPPGTVPVVPSPSLVAQSFENLINSGSFPNNFLFAQGGSVVDRNQRNPYTEQASLSIDRQIGKSLTVSAGYLFVAGHHLVRPIDLNVAPHVARETGTNKDIYAFAINDPNTPAPPGGSNGTNGIFYFTDSTGNSVYHGMTLQATENVGKYFRLHANYTFSRALDDGTYLVFVDTPQSNDQRFLERALSNQNVTHRFVTDFVVDAPEHSFLRNFQLSNIITVQSPRPFTLFVGFDANNDGNPVTDRVGTSGRNTYRGDNLRSWDLRVSRVIHFSERYQLQLMADVFNLLNRPNVDEVYSVYGTYDFCGGLVPHHYKDAVSFMAQSGAQFGTCPPGGPPAPNALFGTPRTTLNPRQFQFAAKLSF